MKRNNLYLKWHSNGFQLKYHNKIENYQTKSVDKYKIINRFVFISDFQKIIQSKKINMRLITDNITIIIDTTFSSTYLEYLTQIMKELSFNQINYVDIKELIPLKNNELIIDISYSSLKFYTLKSTYQFNIISGEYIPIILLYLKILPLPSTTIIKVFGNNKANKVIVKKLNKLINLDIYYYSDNEKIPCLFLKDEI